MDNPATRELERLPKETLIELIKMYSRNWLTMDGLWFTGVEDRYGEKAAIEMDVRMWEIGSRIEAERVKKILGLEPGLENVIRAIDFLSVSYSFGYEYEISDNRVLWTCLHCLPQETRLRMGKSEFACQATCDACFKNIIDVIDPMVRLRCIFCPPGPRPADAWCQWEFSLRGTRRKTDSPKEYS